MNDTGFAMNKIFNIGLNRAGTTSLTSALTTLNISTIHFKCHDVRLVDIIQRNIARNQVLFHGLDSRYTAFSDFAGQHFYQTLDKQYPGSKFILTLREMEEWLDSRERKVRENQKNDDYKYTFLKVDRQQWRDEREAYLEELDEYFKHRDNDLLVIDIPAGDSWNKLCPFLGVKKPSTNFPYMNASGST